MYIHFFKIFWRTIDSFFRDLLFMEIRILRSQQRSVTKFVSIIKIFFYFYCPTARYRSLPYPSGFHAFLGATFFGSIIKKMSCNLCMSCMIWGPSTMEAPDAGPTVNQGRESVQTRRQVPVTRASWKNRRGFKSVEVWHCLPFLPDR